MYEVQRARTRPQSGELTNSKATFEELATRYDEEYAKKKNKSWRQADNQLKRHAIPRLGKLMASSNITRADIKAMIKRIDAPISANLRSPIPARSSLGRSRKT